MKVWLVSCGVFFLAVEVLQWAQEWVVPLPLYIIGGAILAIASNTDKGITTIFQSSQENPVDLSSSSPPQKSPLPPKLKQPQRPISFKIKQTQEKETMGNR